MIEVIENDFLRVGVSLQGGELHNIVSKSDNIEYLWQANPDFWPRKSPVLFPFVGKLNKNEFKFNGVTYPMSSHGFARDQKFELKYKTDKELCFMLAYDQDLLKIYPFKFELQIIYTLNLKSLSITYRVINLDTKEIYFSVGGHPAFNCPLKNGELLTDYYLEFEKCETAPSLLTDGGLMNGKEVPVLMESNILALSEELFNIDTLLFSNLRSSYVKLKSTKSKYELKFTFEGFPFFAIWKKANAAFLCLEPWEGHGDVVGFEGELSEKKGVVALSQGRQYCKSYSIEIA